MMQTEEKLKLYHELDKRWSQGEDVGKQVIALRDELFKEGTIKLINGLSYSEAEDLKRNHSGCISKIETDPEAEKLRQKYNIRISI